MTWRRSISGIVCLLALLTALLFSCRDRGPKSKEDRADDALARVSAIEPELAKLRHLELRQPVPAEYQRTSDFRDFVRRTVVNKHDPDAKHQSEALTALGLLPAATNLGHAIEDAQVTQAAAYYDPGAKKFFIVMVPENDLMLDMIAAHELTHGLQDQHFDLTRYLSGADKGDKIDSDALTARRFVVEGDAMLAMVAYAVFQKTHLRELTTEQLAVIRTQLEKMASLDTAGMVAMLKQQAKVTSKIDPEIQRSLDAMDTIPRTILVPLIQSYMKGALVALSAYKRGRWSAVDDLYRDPPESTEQVLHPEERLFTHQDHPHRVTLPKLEGYEAIASDVLGELQWSVYFSLWKHEGDGHEEQNWGGDRYAVLRDKDGKLVVLIATIWDTKYDAKVFYDSYMSTLRARFPDGAPDKQRVGSSQKRDTIWVRRIENRVYVVDGGTHDMMDTLVDETTFD